MQGLPEFSIGEGTFKYVLVRVSLPPQPGQQSGAGGLEHAMHDVMQPSVAHHTQMCVWPPPDQLFSAQHHGACPESQ